MPGHSRSKNGVASLAYGAKHLLFGFQNRDTILPSLNLAMVTERQTRAPGFVPF